MTRFFNNFVVTLLVVCCWAATVSGFSVSRNKGDLPLDQLVGLADEIVVGTVKSKQTNVVGRHFETDYEVDITESLKGKSAAPGQTLKLTVAGGSLTTPPLTQYVQGTASMYTGEKVALFLSSKPPKMSQDAKRRLGSKSKLASSPRIVGMSQGKFSVIKDEVSGKEKITRFNLEDYGIAPNDVALEKSLRALEMRVLNTVDAPVVPADGQAKACSRPDCLAPFHGHPKDRSKAAAINVSGQQAIEKAGQGGAVPVQDLEQFKDQVRKFAR